MRILGVDPGSLVVGYGCLELRGGRGRDAAAAVGDVPMARRVSNLARSSGGEVVMVVAGALRIGRSTDPIEARLHKLADGVRDLIAKWQPDELAIEEAYFGKSVQSALRIGESRGVILAEAARAGLEIHQFPPARIKRSVTGRGAATKELVGQMVAVALGLARVPQPADVTDALAVGLCRVENKRGIRF